MVNTVTSKESDVATFVGEDLDRRGRGPPRCNRVESSDGLEAFELTETSTANYGDMDRLYEGDVRISIAPILTDMDREGGLHTVERSWEVTHIDELKPRLVGARTWNVDENERLSSSRGNISWSSAQLGTNVSWAPY
jgi:hypothetical protein